MSLSVCNMDNKTLVNLTRPTTQTLDKASHIHNICQNPNLSSAMGSPKANHHGNEESGSRSEQDFRIEGLKQSIIAVYGDALDKIGFSITEKANRSAQSRLGKTLRSLRTMECKEQAQYRRQKQELLENLDRLQGEQLRIRKMKYHHNKNIQKPNTIDVQQQAMADCYQDIQHHHDHTDGPRKEDEDKGSNSIVKETPKVSYGMNLLKQRPSSTIAIGRNTSEDPKHLSRPLTPELHYHLPKLENKQTSLISKMHQNNNTKSVVFQTPQCCTKPYSLQTAPNVDYDDELHPDEISTRDRRSASFSQYGNLRKPKLSRERCISPLVSQSVERNISPIISGYPSKSSAKTQSQTNSPLLARRHGCRGKDWIPPEKEELLAELEGYKLELQERVNIFLAKQNPK